MNDSRRHVGPKKGIPDMVAPHAPPDAPAPTRGAGLTIVLPLPDPLLTPNVRLHWAERAREVKRQRYEARVGTYCQLPDVLPELAPDSRWRLDVEVRPRPRMKRHDDDNLWSALKSYRDGIADALLVDDKQFVIGALVWSEQRTGELVLTLTEVG